MEKSYPNLPAPCEKSNCPLVSILITSVLSSPCPLFQSDCVCSGQRDLPEGSERRGRVLVRVIDRRRDHQKCPGSRGGVQQTRYSNPQKVFRELVETFYLFLFFFSCLNRRIHSFLSHKVIAVHWVCSHIPRQECPNIWAFTAYSKYIQVIHWCLYLVDITMAKSAKLIQQQLEKEL